MKYVFISLLIFCGNYSYSQLSIELAGGIGFDIKQFETKYTNNNTPLTHSYTYDGLANNVEFTILEPRYLGGRFFWKFLKKIDLSLGLEVRYTKRDIIGTFYSTTNPINSSFSEMDINIEYYSCALMLRKKIKLNERNRLFIEPSIFYSSDFKSPTNGYFSGTLETIPEANRQLVQYREGEEYYNLIEIYGYGSILNYELKQGYLMNITPKMSLGFSTSVSFAAEETAEFIIWSWNSQEEKKGRSWSPNGLKFTSVMFDLFLAYEF